MVKAIVEIFEPTSATGLGGNISFWRGRGGEDILVLPQINSRNCHSISVALLTQDLRSSYTESMKCTGSLLVE